MNRIYKGYIFVLQGEDDVIEDENHQHISILLKVFSEGLYWNKVKGQFEFNEADLCLYRKIEAKILASTDLYNWLDFAKISGSLMRKKHFELLEKVPKKSKDKPVIVSEIHFEVMDYLQEFIKKYFENPDRYNAIYEWISLSDKKNLLIFMQSTWKNVLKLMQKFEVIMLWQIQICKDYQH